MKALVDALRGNTSAPPPKPPEMGGMAGEAQKTLGSAESYRAYAEAMIAQGKKPVTLAEYVKGLR